MTEFLIKWAGFDSSHNTWEPKKNLLNEQLLDSWRLENPNQKKRKLSSKLTDPKVSSSYQNSKEVTREKVKASNLVRKQSTEPVSQDDTSDPISANKKAKTASSTSKPQSKLSGIFQVENLKMIKSHNVTVQIIELILSKEK